MSQTPVNDCTLNLKRDISVSFQFYHYGLGSEVSARDISLVTLTENHRNSHF